ncbi:MAG TPA: glycosyltransferase family 4 protein [Rhizomicrobium sp.]
MPEHNAPAQRVYDHCKRWVDAGARVTVITGVPNFPTGVVQAPYRNRLYQRETIDGIEVVRVWTFLAPNSGIVLRTLDFISYAATSFFAGLFQSCDVIVATSPQLLTAFSGAMLSTMKRRPWVFEVRDLWPDSITAVNAMRIGPLISFLRWLERRLYISADRIVTISDPMKTAIAAKGIPATKVSIVPNGATTRLQPEEKGAALAESLGLTGKFVVGYVGTHGLAHDLETVLRAAAKLQARDDIRFLLVGEGARKKALQEMAAGMGLTNLSFVGPVLSTRVAAYLALCDALLVPLKNMPISSGAIPSKIFDAAVMERPVLLGVPGTAAELIERYGAGLVVEPESPGSLAEAVERLAGDAALCQTCRAGGRALAKDYGRDSLADRMLETITAVVRAPRR